MSIMSIKDVEDVYMFMVMVCGLVTLGFGLFAVYRKLNKLGSDLAGYREVFAETLHDEFKKQRETGADDSE